MILCLYGIMNNSNLEKELITKNIFLAKGYDLTTRKYNNQKKGSRNQSMEIWTFLMEK